MAFDVNFTCEKRREFTTARLGWENEQQLPSETKRKWIEDKKKL